MGDGQHPSHHGQRRFETSPSRRLPPTALSPSKRIRSQSSSSISDSTSNDRAKRPCTMSIVEATQHDLGASLADVNGGNSGSPAPGEVPLLLLDFLENKNSTIWADMPKLTSAELQRSACRCVEVRQTLVRKFFEAYIDEETMGKAGGDGGIQELKDATKEWSNIFESGIKILNVHHKAIVELGAAEQVARAAFEGAKAGNTTEDPVLYDGESMGFSSNGGGRSSSGPRPWVTSAPACLAKPQAISLLTERMENLHPAVGFSSDPSYRGRDAEFIYESWTNQRQLQDLISTVRGERIGHAAPTDVKDTNLQASTTASDVWYTLLRASSELVKARTKATDTAVSIYRALTAMAQQTAQLAYTSVRGKRQTSGIPPDEMVQLAAGWTAAGDESHGTAQVTSHNDEQDQDQDTSGETMGERSPCIRAAAERPRLQARLSPRPLSERNQRYAKRAAKSRSQPTQSASLNSRQPPGRAAPTLGPPADVAAPITTATPVSRRTRQRMAARIVQADQEPIQPMAGDGVLSATDAPQAQAIAHVPTATPVSGRTRGNVAIRATKTKEQHAQPMVGGSGISYSHGAAGAANRQWPRKTRASPPRWRSRPAAGDNMPSNPAAVIDPGTSVDQPIVINDESDQGGEPGKRRREEDKGESSDVGRSGGAAAAERSTEEAAGPSRKRGRGPTTRSSKPGKQ